jgi:serine-type D-Ala-D-Ala carboxypeptidase (penicillin-binding protein 5/6)
LEGVKVNRYFFRKNVASVLAIIMFFSLFVGINKAKAEVPLNVSAAGAILVDGQTGKVLYEKNADSMLGIASMSKMMTEYLLFDSIKRGRVKWEQEYTVNSFVSDLSHKTELSNVPLTSEGKYTIKELYNQMAIYSSNSATIAIAETIAGSEANFVKMMNDKAKKLGLQNYKFVNSTGLNNSDYQGHQPTGGPDDENAMSPRSVATLAFHLISDFPKVLETTSITKSKSVDGVNMPNWNWMLPGLVYGYQGMDGLKTGTTDFAGYCFTGTAMRDGKRFISVVQNATDASGQGSYEARFGETRKMMDYAFSNFTLEEIIPKNYQIKGYKTLPVVKGKEKKVEITTNVAIKMVVLSGEKNNFKPVLKLDKSKLTENGELEAPIKKGEKIGTLTIQPKNNEKVSFLTAEGQQKLQADVVAANTVEKSNWFVLMMRGIGGFFGDLFGGISSAVKGWF